MPKIDFSTLQSETAAGRFRPVYFFHGDETYLTRQAVELLIGRAVDQATADFNYERFHGGELDAGRLMTALSTPPMMAARRVVLVRNFDKAPLDARTSLADYAAKPSSSTVLVLAADGRIRIDARRRSPKWAASLQESAASAIFWPLREHKLLRWMSATARAKGKALNMQVARELYARVGDDLARLADDLEKLAVFCGEREEITGEDVSRMTGIDKGGTVFDWVDALATGRTVLSCYVAGYLQSRGESAVGAVAAASAHFTRVARIREMLEQDRSAGEIKKALRLNHWRDDAVSELFRQARKYTAARLDRAFSLLLEADLQLKSSSLPGSTILENLSFRFAGEVQS